VVFKKQNFNSVTSFICFYIYCKMTKDLDAALAELESFSQTIQGQTKKPPSKDDPELDALLGNLASEMATLGLETDPNKACNSCKKAIQRGKAISACGKQWHIEHFTCFTCSELLTENTYLEHDGSPYCLNHYHQQFSPKCEVCNLPITTECVRAGGTKTFHDDCFKCSHCAIRIKTVSYVQKDDKFYCEKDYYELYGEKCALCSKPIIGQSVKALAKTWHPEHFHCNVCKKPFGGGAFYEIEGQAFCEKDYHASRGTLCSICSKPILGKAVSANNQKYHIKCFECTYCKKPLAGTAFRTNYDKPYCKSCHTKLFG